MSDQRARSHPMRRLSKAVFAILGGVAIFLAVALGLFRLAVAQIPAYQAELKAWVATELGMVVDFGVVDARLGLTGPELTLLDASIGSGREFLQADRATITLDPVALTLGRRIDISRLTLDGVLLTVERDDTGTFRLGDYALTSGDSSLVDSIPQSVEVAIRDSELRYLDSARDETWTFTELELEIEDALGGYVASATLTPPEELAAELSLGITVGLPQAGASDYVWRIDVQTGGLNLDVLSSLLPLGAEWSMSGSGSLGAHAEMQGDELTRIGLDLDLADLRLGPAGTEPFEHLRVAADWQRQTAGSWRLEIEDIDLLRAGRSWGPRASAAFALELGSDERYRVSLESDFVRLEDLQPFVAAFPETQLAEQWELFDPIGEVSDLSFELQRRNADFDYELEATFDRVAVRQVGPTPGIRGISGRVEAIEDSGTIEFDTAVFEVDWPLLFSRTVEGESLEGAVVWGQEQDIVQIWSVDLAVGVLGRIARASFDLELPQADASAVLDLQAELAAVDLVPAKQYLPTRIIPAAVVEWLDRALVGGRASDIEMTYSGPIDAFPFDNGEGQLRVTADVEGTVLDYLADWPRATGIEGHIEFLNAGFFAEASSGEALGNRARDFALDLADMRQPVLELSVETEGALASVVDYLRAVPLIAERLGPGFERIEARDGSGSIRADLVLPLTDRAAFELDAGLEIEGGALAVRGLRPEFSELNGVLRAEEDMVSADGIQGVFVGGPISVALRRSDRPGYRAELEMNGETSMPLLASAFGIAPIARVEGQTLWRGRLLLPELDPLATTPTRITVDSNLAGVALRLPEPLSKAPGDPINLALDLQFAAGNRLEVAGNLGATRRFALAFAIAEDAVEFTRGAVQFGGGEPLLPLQPGILVRGEIEALELDPWLVLGRDTGINRAGALFLGADVQVGGMHAFGQQLGETSLRVERGPADWQISLDSEAIAGEISVPRQVDGRGSIHADMSRVYLAAAGESDLADADPRTLPGMVIEADEFGFGNRQLGHIVASVEPVADGLRLTEFTSQTENFRTEITGSWLKTIEGSRTVIDAEIRSTDVASALAELGLDPVVEGESASVTASVQWASAPTAAWLDHLNGQVSLFVETGTLREVDPGAGRMLGLMSIAALPRRLLLDFRDVFEEGFAFDEISGSFNLIDGNAFTNDLKFGGPAAEIGVVGRTGLRDRDYRQQIVVAPEPSNMLPTVGGLLGGAGVGAALLIFTRLFKEPLKGIGRASYCLSGDWDDPQVELIDDDEPAEAERCAELPPEMRPAIEDE